MEYFFLLSGSNLDLSKLELKSLLDMYSIKGEIKDCNGPILLDTDESIPLELFERSSLIKSCGRVIEKVPSNLEKLEKIFSEISWSKWVKSPFKLRIKDLVGKYSRKVMPLEEGLSKYIWKSLSNPDVDLENPRTSIYVFLKKNKFYLTKLVWKSKPGRFKERQPNQKPGFHPTILKPRLARVLVNLSRAREGLLDPFCGTGAVLIEAGLIGCEVMGSDLDPEMLEKSEENLKHFSIKDYELKELDATQLSQEFKKDSVDAICTDPPYRRSSFSSKENVSELYNEFLVEVSRVLRKGKYISFMIPKGTELKVPESLHLKDKVDLYVHGGLTRRILVLKEKL